MATAPAGDTANILKGLIQSCQDGAHGFHAAAVGVTDPTLERLFESYGEQLAEFAAELQQEAIRLGEPVSTRAPAGETVPAWHTLQTEARRLDEARIIAACEDGEHVTVRAFREASRKQLPGSIGVMVERLFLQLREAHAHIRTLEQHTSRVR